MANHGAVTYGNSVFDAFQKMETLEHVAQIRLVNHQLGCERALEGEQAERLRQARERYLQNAN
jgi:L-fuculose-phosphate aldolase